MGNISKLTLKNNQKRLVVTSALVLFSLFLEVYFLEIETTNAAPTYVVTTKLSPDFRSVLRLVTPARVEINVFTHNMNISKNNIHNFEFETHEEGQETYVKKISYSFSEAQENIRDKKEELKNGHLLDQGMGFLISKDGYILTSSELLNGGDTFKVTLSNKKEQFATLIGQNLQTNVAILKIHANSGLPYIKFAKNKDILIGDWVFQIFNRIGEKDALSFGILSGKQSGTLNQTIQTDLFQINMLKTKGPGTLVFNKSGQAIGISFGPTSFDNFWDQGMSYVLTSDVCSKMIKNIVNKNSELETTFNPNFKNIEAKSATELELVVESVDEGFLFDQKLDFVQAIQVKKILNRNLKGYDELQQGDLILKINGYQISDVPSFYETIDTVSSTNPVLLQVFRNGKLYKLLLSPRVQSTKKDFSSKEHLKQLKDKQYLLSTYGIGLSEDVNSVPGLIVTSLLETSHWQNELELGDKIISINNQDIQTIQSFKTVLEKQIHKNKKAILLEILRNDKQDFMIIKL